MRHPVQAIGFDETLLRTRSAVLRQTHANVVERYGAEFADLGQHQFDLVVMCYTIPDSQREALAAEVRRLWPEARIIQVSASHLTDLTAPEYADALATWGQPDELVAMSVDLLRDKRNGKGNSFSPNSSSAACV
jgi:hypothetical protein